MTGADLVAANNFRLAMNAARVLGALPPPAEVLSGWIPGARGVSTATLKAGIAWLETFADLYRGTTAATEANIRAALATLNAVEAGR